MPRTSRPRASSATASIAAFRDAGLTASIPWPVGVATHDDPTTQAAIEQVFRATLASRSLPDWERHSDVAACARYARTIVEIQTLTKVLEHEGFVILSSKGAQMAHPAVNARTALESQATTCLRQLSLFGSNVDPRALRQAGQTQARAAAVLDRAKHPLLYGHDDDANSLLA